MEAFWELIRFGTVEEGFLAWEELRVLIPELIPLEGMEQPSDYHAFDGREHTIRAVLAISRDDLVLRAAALFHDIGKPLVKAWSEEKGRLIFHKHADAGAKIAEEVLTRLGIVDPEKGRIVALVDAHEFQYSADWSDKAVRRLMRKLDIYQLAELRRADLKAQGADPKHEYDENVKVGELIARAATLTP